VLRVLNTLGGKASVGDIHARTGYPKPTIVRLFETLIHAGYVNRDALERTYVLTAKTLSLCEGFRSYDHLLARARPIHDSVRERLVWPSDLAVLDRNAMVILDTNRQPGTLWFNRTAGSRVPILLTALGRAVLAFMNGMEQERVLTDLTRSDDPHDRLARNPDRVRKILDETRARGFAISNKEFMPQTRAAAFPIFFQGKAVASVNVIVVADAMSIEKLIERYSPTLTKMVKDIEKTLDGPSHEEAAPRQAINEMVQLSR